MPSIASSKANMCTSRDLSQRKAGPWKRDWKNRKEQTAFYDRFQPSAGPGKEQTNSGKELFFVWFSFRYFLQRVRIQSPSSKYDQRDLENLCSALPSDIAVLRIFWKYLRQICKVPIKSSRIFISQFSREEEGGPREGVLIAKRACIWKFQKGRQILVKT